MNRYRRRRAVGVADVVRAVVGLYILHEVASLLAGYMPVGLEQTPEGVCVVHVVPIVIETSRAARSTVRSGKRSTRKQH